VDEAVPGQGVAIADQQAVIFLSINRETVGGWLARATTGGLMALLDRSVPAGHPSALDSAVRSDLEQALHNPEGFGSYDEIHRWIAAQHMRSIILVGSPGAAF
jgi:hypothetical protein